MTHFKQGSEEWHVVRRNHITATDAPVILGLSPFKTRRELFLEKMGLYEQPVTAAMSRAVMLEDTARKHFEQYIAKHVFPAVVFCKDEPWMMASLDGMDIDGTFGVEIKCPGKTSHTKSKKKVPAHYYAQIQHQMKCSGLDLIYYYSYYIVTDESVPDIICHIVHRDNEFISSMIIQEREFYERLQTLDIYEE
jgi:putative phage-type endonuclease